MDNIRKVRLLNLIAFILFISKPLYQEIVNPSTQSDSFFIIWCYIMLKICAYGVGYLLFIIFVLSTSQIIASINYWRKGFGFSPVLLYPLILISEQKQKVCLNLNFLDYGKYIFPKKFVVQTKNVDDLKPFGEISSKVLYHAYIGQFIAIVTFGVIMLFIREWAIVLSVICVIFGLYYGGNIENDYYIGLLTLSKQMKTEKIAIHLANQSILYQTEQHQAYIEFENQVLSGKVDYNSLQILQTVVHLYLLKSIGRYEIKQAVLDEIHNEMCIEKNSEFSNPMIGDEKWSILKCAFFSSMVNNDKKTLKSIIRKIASLNTEIVNYSYISSPYTEYLMWGNDYMVGKSIHVKRKKDILRNNYLYNQFQNYKLVGDELFSKVLNM